MQILTSNTAEGMLPASIYYESDAQSGKSVK